MKSLIRILIAFPSAMWSGYVLSTLWRWFAVPLGVLPIGIAHAYGLMCIAAMFLGSLYGTLTRDDKAEDDTTARLAHTIAFAAIWPAFMLLIGWITKECM